MTKPNTLLIAGYYGFHNLGDEMILAGLLDALRRLQPDMKPIVVCGDQQDTQRRHEVDTVSWTDLDAIAAVAAASRLVILGGGGLFHDRHDFPLELSHLLTSNHAGLTYYTDICLLAHMAGVPYVLAGVGVGPLQTQVAQQLTAWCFQHAAATTVRDLASLEQLRNLSDLSETSIRKVEVTADLAFVNPSLATITRKSKPKDDRCRLAIIPRHWAAEIDGNAWEGALAGALAQVDADEIVFLSFQALDDSEAVDDREVCRRIMSDSSLSGKEVRLEAGLLSEKWVAEVLLNCSAVVAMRYHGALAGLQLGRPVLAMAYDPKVSALMDQSGLGEWALLPDQWTQPTLLKRLERLNSEKPTVSPSRLQDLMNSSRRTFDQIETIWASEEADTSSTSFILHALFESKVKTRSLLAEQQEILESQERLLAELEEARTHIQFSELEAFRLREELNQIHTSRYWRMMGWYWSLRHKLGRLLRRLRGLSRRLLSWPHTLFRIYGPGFGTSNRRPLKFENWELRDAKPGKADILLFPIIDWDFRIQRPQQLARRLADAGHRIFYFKTTFSGGDLTYRQCEQGVYEIQLPGPGSPSIYRDAPIDADVQVQLRGLAELAHAAQIAEAVCLVQLPYWAPLAEAARRHHGWPLVYDCLDEHAGFSTNTKAMLGLEEGLLQSSDLVLATSERLYQKCQAFNSNLLRLPNAVDRAHFARAVEGMPAPADFPDVDGPVAGYIGAISDWFDFDLLRQAVKQLPQVTFYLIGDTWGSDPHSDLSAEPKVIFAGEKPYQDLPAYLAQFDVCLIPFKDIPLTQATDPVKVYEYLAAGRPVVARRLPELEKFKGQIQLIDNPSAFVQAITEALEGNGGTQMAARQAAVADQDWSVRVDVLQTQLATLFPSVSLVIPVWNQLEQTRDCLTSLLESTRLPHLEVILVDNGSSGETADYLQRLSQGDDRIKLLRWEENQGFAPAVNAGLKLAEGEILGILNNDVILTRGWLSRLLGHLTRDESIGMIGPVTDAVGNEARMDFSYRDRNGLDEFASQIAYSYAGCSAPIPMLAMYCALLRRSTYERLGGLDERFSIGMFEDDDFAIRLRQAGLRTACARDVFIHHHGQASFEQLGSLRYRDIFQSNRLMFETKWGIGWTGHSYSGLEEYESSFRSLEETLSEPDLPIVIVPQERRKARGSEKLQEVLEKLSGKRALLVFWGADGMVEVETEGKSGVKLPWVALDHVESPWLIAPDGVPTADIWLRLRRPRPWGPPFDVDVLKK